MPDRALGFELLKEPEKEEKNSRGKKSKLKKTLSMLGAVCATTCKGKKRHERIKS